MIYTKGIYVVLMLTAVCWLGGCADRQRERNAALEPGLDEMPLGYLNTKDYRIIITSSPHEPLYTVSTQKGSVLARDLSLLELSVRFPELRQVVETGTADLDARLGPSQPEVVLP